MAQFELIFVIPDVTDPADSRIAKAEEQLDIVVEAHSGLALATVTADGVDAVDAATNAAAILEACGLCPVRSHPDLVTRQDIADRAEVSRQAVGNWVRGDRIRSDPFPAPTNLVGGGVWLWGDVVEWLRRHGHEIEQIGLPSLDDHTRIDEALLGHRHPADSLLIRGHISASAERTEIRYGSSISSPDDR